MKTFFKNNLIFIVLLFTIFILVGCNNSIDEKFVLYVIPNNYEYGKVSGEGIYNIGSQVLISATPEINYKFESWSDGITENPRNVIVGEVKTFTAIFVEKDKYTISIDINGNRFGSVAINERKNNLSFTTFEGEKVTISAIPNEDCRFIGWSDGETSAVRTIDLSHDYNLTANFEEGNLFVINGHNVKIINAKANISGDKLILSATTKTSFGYWSSSQFDENYILGYQNSLEINIADINEDITFTANNTFDNWFFGLTTSEEEIFNDKVVLYNLNFLSNWVEYSTEISSNTTYIHSYISSGSNIIKMYGDADYYTKILINYALDSSYSIFDIKYRYDAKVFHTADGTKYVKYYSKKQFDSGEIHTDRDKKEIVTYDDISIAIVYDYRLN